MKPSSFNCPLSANRTASQRNVASVSPCVAMSSSVSTLVISIRPSPPKATLVTLSSSASAKIQPETISANATAVIHSSRDSGPSAASALRAATGASGVSPTPGGNSRATTQGSSRIAVSAGTEAATATCRSRSPVRTPSPSGCRSDWPTWPSSRAPTKRQGSPSRRTSDSRRAAGPRDRRAASLIPAPPTARSGRGRHRARCCSETPARSPRR